MSACMEGNVRKRNSMWDVPDASRHNYRSQKDHNSTGDGRRHQTLSPIEADNDSIKPKDGSKWSSRERSDSKNSVQMNESVYDDRQREWGQRKYNHSPDDLGKSHRYLEQGSGRSRSRDRGRTRGRSRSRSRGGDLHDWSSNRSRSRSRSRSKNKKRAGSRTTSRSPPNDHRHDSHGQTDRIAPRSTSHVCRDFAAGMCRRGSQCRFLHTDNVISGDGNSTQNDSAERCRNRPELGHTERYLNNDGPAGHSRGKVYDSNYGEDERFQSRNRGTINCREFLKGNCKWGASCRFSHHVPSGDNNVRKASFDRDNEPQSQETSKTMCRYFRAGNCHRMNCKFSHHVPTSNNHEDRPRDENIAWQDGKTWNEVVGSKSEKAEATCQSKNVVTITGTTDVVANIKTDDPWDKESNSWVDAQDEKNALMENINVPQQPLWNQNNAGDAGSIKSMTRNSVDRYEDHIHPDIKMDDQWGAEAKRWVSVQSENSAAVEDRILTNHPWNKNNDGGTGSIGSIMSKTLKDEYEDHHITAQNLHTGSMDEISMAVHGQNASSQNNDVSSMHVEGSIGSDVERKKFGEGGILKNFTFDRHDVVVMDPGITINPLVPGGGNNGSGVGNVPFDHLVSNDHKDTFSQNPSDERNFDLNSADQQLLRSLNLPNQNSYQKEVVKAPPQNQQEFFAPQSFHPESSFSQVAQMSYHDASATHKLVNELVEPHPWTPNNFISTGFIPSAQSLVPPVYLHSNLASMRPPESYNLLSDVRDPNASNFRSGHLPCPLEKHDEMILEPFSPPSIVNPELEPFSPPSTVVKSENSDTFSVGKASLQRHHQDAIEQGVAVVGSQEVLDKIDVVGCKEEEEENTNKESSGGKDKAEHGTNNKEEESNKEEKDVRLFKNALVEFVKDVLKPRWKEGRMSREVHKTIVKKVVDKVSSAIQASHIPKTKDKVEQYLSSSKPKISKLVQAYVERHVKAES